MTRDDIPTPALLLDLDRFERNVRRMAAHARAAGYGSVLLTTDRELPWNGPFYRRHGFSELAPDRLPAPLLARLRLEAEAGFDPLRRCAMACPVEP